MLPDLEPRDNQKYKISEKSCGGYFFRNRQTLYLVKNSTKILLDEKYTSATRIIKDSDMKFPTFLN